MSENTKQRIEEAAQALDDCVIDSKELRKRVLEALGSLKESKAQEYVRLMKEREEANKWKV